MDEETRLSGIHNEECEDTALSPSEETPHPDEHTRRAQLDQETAHAQKEAADAQRAAAEVQAKVEKDRIKQAKLAYKQAKREHRSQYVKLLTRIPKIVWLIIPIALVITAAGASIIANDNAPVEVSLSSRLTNIVNVSRLSTARFAYEGIAEKKNDEKEVEYRVSYRADVEASVDMSQINFDTIDHETKTIFPVLPEIALKTTVDDTSFEFFEQNPQTNTKDVISICRKDAAKEIAKNSDLLAIATENLRDTAEALASPLLSSEGYAISWEEPPAKDKPASKTEEPKHE